MNSTAASILADPHPCAHIVYPYTDEAHVTEAVCAFASAGLRKSEAVPLIMTKVHRDAIRRRLERDGFNLAALERTGQLRFIDAEELLSTFMVDGAPDSRLFESGVRKIIDQAKLSSGSRPPRKVRIFGEMVSLLWKASPAAAQSLEELWNQAIKTHSVSLLCTYALGGEAMGAFPESLLGCHSHNLA
jgi:KaiC/GvpD/RAD55 family RecA-like ATPase